MEDYLKNAIEEYEYHIERNLPLYMDASTLMDIEDYYEKEGRTYDAERILRYAEKLHPDNEAVQVVRAYQLRDKGKWEEALQIVQQIPGQASRDVTMFHIEYEVANGRPDLADRILEQTVPTPMQSEDYDWYLDFAEVLYDYGYLSRALKYLHKLPSDYIFNGQAERLVSSCYLLLQDYPKSQAATEKIIDKAPYDVMAWLQLAEIQQKQNKYEECMTSCDYALAIDENNTRAANMKVYCEFVLKHYDKGFALCNEYRVKFPDEYTFRMYAGEQYCKMEKWENSLSYNNEALRLCPMGNPDRQRIITYLAYAYANLDESTERAEEIMKSQVIAGTRIVELYLTLGEIYVESGKVKQAYDLWLKALNMPSSEDRDKLTVIQSLNRIQRYAEAVELLSFIGSSQMGPDAYGIYAEMAYAMRGLGEPKLFSHFLKQAIVHCPDRFFALFGRIYGMECPDEILNKARKDLDKMTN